MVYMMYEAKYFVYTYGIYEVYIYYRREGIRLVPRMRGEHTRFEGISPPALLLTLTLPTPLPTSPLACLMMNESPASDQHTTSLDTLSIILNVRSKNIGMLLMNRSICSESRAPAAAAAGGVAFVDSGTSSKEDRGTAPAPPPVTKDPDSPGPCG